MCCVVLHIVRIDVLRIDLLRVLYTHHDIQASPRLESDEIVESYAKRSLRRSLLEIVSSLLHNIAQSGMDPNMLYYLTAANRLFATRIILWELQLLPRCGTSDAPLRIKQNHVQLASLTSLR